MSVVPRDCIALALHHVDWCIMEACLVMISLLSAVLEAYVCTWRMKGAAIGEP